MLYKSLLKEMLELFYISPHRHRLASALWVIGHVSITVRSKGASLNFQ